MPLAGGKSKGRSGLVLGTVPYFPAYVKSGNRFSLPSDALLPRDKDNVFVSMKTQTVDQMIYFRQYNVMYDYEFDNHFSISTRLRYMTQNPTGSLFYRTLSGENVTELTQSEATLTLRYAPGEAFVTTKQRRHPVNNNAPIFTLMHTTGFKGLLGGDYESNYTEFSVYKRFWLNSFGRQPFLLFPVYL